MKQLLQMTNRPPRTDRLVDSVLIVLTMTGLQRMIGFGRSVLFCLWLSVEELGQWDIAFCYLTLAVPFVVLSLPGAFGRYVPYFQQRGQLRTFLRRVLTITTVLGAAAALCVLTNRAAVSQLVFGRPDGADLVLALVYSLLALVAYSVISELLISLRLQRLASGLELVNTVAFALIAALLLAGWRSGTLPVVLAYGTACLVSALVALAWLVPLWRSLPMTAGPPLGTLAICAKIVPFAAALWLSNALGNLFSIADRYVLVHYSGRDAVNSLTMVGEYHGSRIVPALLPTICGLLSTVAIPFLSHDWETGCRSRVSRRLNLLLKLGGLGLIAASTAVLFLSPFLFGQVFGGKFQTAPQVVSLALAYSCWNGLAGLSKTYLWCAERAILVSVAYAVALLASIGMNLLLVPRFGIYGAAQGTCVAQAALLLLIYSFSRAYGLKLHPATWLISALPLALAFGPWASLASLAAVCAVATFGNWVFDAADKREMAATVARYRAKLACLTTAGAFRIGRNTARARIAHSDAEIAGGDRRPLRVMFIHTSLFVGGAETLLLELVRGFDRERIVPEICCLKDGGPLRPQVPDDVPVFERLIDHKYDVLVIPRLARLLRERKIDAIVTVGAGDRMFWGRLAAWLVGVPVIAAWIHSTGWPDRLGRLNRLLTPLTDAFIGVARSHGSYLVDVENLPAGRVYVVENGVDIERFRPRSADSRLRGMLGVPATAPVAGVVARLSYEKNHELFLRVAAMVRKELNEAHFLVVGDGPLRGELESLTRQLGLEDAVHFLGNRTDVPELLALLDVFVLPSHIEASPISILEALATGKPVVATRVGSVAETVGHGEVGYVVERGDAAAMAWHIVDIFRDPGLARRLGAAGRHQVVERSSVPRMIGRYEHLLEQLFAAKQGRSSANTEADEEEPFLVTTPLPSEG